MRVASPSRVGTPAQSPIVEFRTNHGCFEMRRKAVDWTASSFFLPVLQSSGHQASDAYSMTARTICRKMDTFVFVAKGLVLLRRGPSSPEIRLPSSTFLFA
jgi:hypothetical protein